MSRSDNLFDPRVIAQSGSSWAVVAARLSWQLDGPGGWAVLAAVRSWHLGGLVGSWAALAIAGVMAAGQSWELRGPGGSPALAVGLPWQLDCSCINRVLRLLLMLLPAL